jgi:hypothetical protein
VHGLPHFLDLFLEELRTKRERFQQSLTGEGASELDGFLQKVFQAEWHDLPAEKRHDLRVVAIDSGRSQRVYSPGTFVYICRAIAVASSEKSRRKIVADSHTITTPREQLSNLVSLRSEHLEHEVALMALQDYSDIDVLLIDGSLYGRTLHVPMVFNYPGERDLYLQFIQTFNQLIEECRKRKILLLGVSKDSVASHLTQLLLPAVRKQVLNSITPHLTDTQILTLQEHLDDIPKSILPLIPFVKTLPLTEKQRELLWNLINELRHPRPDFALIFAWTKTKGFATPIQPYPDVPFYKYEAKRPKEYVQRRFAIASFDYSGSYDEFTTWAVEAMQKAFHLPTFITFCAKLLHNDTPMRIDLPAFNVGLPQRVSEISKSTRLKPIPQRIETILQILQSDYGGQDLYNVWLVHADKEARLPERDVTSLYEPLIQKELKIQLIPTRGDRRKKVVVKKKPRS